MNRYTATNSVDLAFRAVFDLNRLRILRLLQGGEARSPAGASVPSSGLPAAGRAGGDPEGGLVELLLARPDLERLPEEPARLPWQVLRRSS